VGLRVIEPGRFALGLLLHVVPGGEAGPVTVEDDDAAIGVALSRVECSDELLLHGAADGVPALRAVEGDEGDAPGANIEELVGHARLSLERLGCSALVGSSPAGTDEKIRVPGPLRRLRPHPPAPSPIWNGRGGGFYRSG